MTIFNLPDYVKFWARWLKSTRSRPGLDISIASIATNDTTYHPHVVFVIIFKCPPVFRNVQADFYVSHVKPELLCS